MADIPRAPVEIELTYLNKVHTLVNGIFVYTLYVKCIDYVAMPLEANVRQPSESSPYKSMCTSLVEEPDMFFFKNGGINVIAEDVKFNESKNTVKISFKNNYGILNGGHTQKAILDTKDEHDIDDSAIVRVEIIVWKDLKDSMIADFASAKNSASNVKSYSIANKKGFFLPLKKEMREEYESKITWFENEPVEGRTMYATELIAILNMFDLSRYDRSSPPNASANAPGNVFSAWLDANDSGNVENWYKIYPLVNDILDLYEYIQSTFNKNIGNGLTKRDIIKKVPKGSKNSKTIFTGKPVEFILPKQISMALLGCFRADLKKDDDGNYVWKIPPTILFDSVKKDLTRFVNDFLKQNDINKLSKDPNAWTSLYNQVLVYILGGSS